MGYNTATFALKESDVVGFTEAQRTSVELQLAVSIVSEGKLEYKNFRYPRFKNFYGYAQLMSGAYVVQAIELSYLNQEVYYFQQSSSEILQSIGCGVKKILANLTPPVQSQVDLYLLRQRITSVRFRFHPTVLANCTINWHFIEQLCDENIIAPPEGQGNPGSPHNDGYNPGDRPASQGGDSKDNSPNDGDSPTSGQNPPPKTGSTGQGATWKVILKFYDGQSQQQTSRFDTQVSDPSAQVTTSRTPVPGAQRPDGRTDYYLILTVNGNSTITQASGGDLDTVSIYFGL